MESIDTELAAQIRNDIILGMYGEKERLSEARLCDTHNVSRTPVRLALRMLEHEGLIRRSEGRGYFVNAPKVADILQAVLVRGHLESLAARLMSQSPGRHNVMPNLEAAIEEIDRLIDAGKMDDASLRALQSQNAVFHKTILDGCGNDFVGFTCSRISHLPMLEVGAMMFDRQVLSTADGIERSLFRLKIGNSQHKVIFEAIQSGDAVRAEGVMREHSNTMVEYIKVFEKRDEELTIKDLIGYSGVGASGQDFDTTFNK
ncbi:GntR family transcriptional regulator [Planktotalea frisia]|jgi:GntR family transcriptional regulator of vanillate catabolism|uniref:Putative HTH-type transcriptional regulator YurK n=1 Tax=Planktotalea frisia TaxID=696762 RepID=A0A1L9NU23_9RHOB|nr:GntR family transcriptional regulator [Planktotalea frisia]OJI92800.1 putative HTH-type transcriptional regulator YurK [Planktotalea frisia]PZX24857.1 GntR family transcriptional regulator [Planktotalea frisia]